MSCRQNMSPQQIGLIRKVTWGGMAVNVSLAGIKFLVGFLGASQAVIADAVHSLSDMSTDIAVILGVRFWSAPPDKDHPYGHQRIEALVTVAIGLALVSVAVGLGYNSVLTIHDDHIGEIGWVAVIGPILSILAKEALYQWTAHVGKLVKSTAVMANAWHHRSDALSSIPALIAVVVAALYPDWRFVDQIGAVIIAVFILKVSWDIIVPALQELSDAGASLRAQEQIRNLTMTVKGVKDTHAIRTRIFGSRLYVDLHILVDPELSVRAGHSISEDVKQCLLQQGPDVLDVVVHIEPYDAEETDTC
ncbi:MAG: cation diffusion facilitator family transporter [Candidatus Electrothrix sp. YB6]